VEKINRPWRYRVCVTVCVCQIQSITNRTVDCCLQSLVCWQWAVYVNWWFLTHDDDVDGSASHAGPTAALRRRHRVRRPTLIRPSVTPSYRRDNVELSGVRQTAVPVPAESRRGGGRHGVHVTRHVDSIILTYWYLSISQHCTSCHYDWTQPRSVYHTQ